MKNKPKPKTQKNYEKEILNYIKKFPSGINITDISNGINISRITVSKYVLVLEAKGKLFSKKIGAYTLYLTTKSNFIPRKAIILFYQGLLSSFKDEILEKREDVFKKIGLNMNKFISFPVGSRFPRDIASSKNGSYKALLNYYAKIYPLMDYIVGKNAVIDTEINEKGTKAIYRFKNVKILEDSTDFIMHFYIVTGMIEKTLSKLIKRNVICKVEKIQSNNIDISIEIL